jgi:predicted acyltransferase
VPAAQLTLLVVAGWLAWRPAETFPWSAVAAASVVLALAAWGWRRTSPSTRNALGWTAAFVAVAAALGLAGRDKVFQDANLTHGTLGQTTNMDCDIVYSNGSFTIWPEGIQE